MRRGVILDLVDDGRQLAGSESKFLCGPERLRLQLEFARGYLHAPENSLELDLNVHEPDVRWVGAAPATRDGSASAAGSISPARSERECS